MFAIKAASPDRATIRGGKNDMFRASVAVFRIPRAPVVLAACFGSVAADPIDRYSVGDRSGMRPDAEGGLTTDVQKDSPGADKESNWLPAPEGQLFMIRRTDLPSDDIVNQTWLPPKIAAVQEGAAMKRAAGDAS